MCEPGRSASNSLRSATPSHMSMPDISAARSSNQRVRPRKGVPQRCLQGDCFLDCAPAQSPPLTKQDVAHMQHNAVAYDDPPYAPNQKRKAAAAHPGYPHSKASTTRSQRRRVETSFYSHDSSSDLDMAATADGEVGVRRSTRQRRTVARTSGFEGYNDSLELELSADDVVILEEEEEVPAHHTSHVFQSREEALAALAQDVMRTVGVQSFRICLELANDLARYKHPHLPDWPKYTQHCI